MTDDTKPFTLEEESLLREAYRQEKQKPRDALRLDDALRRPYENVLRDVFRLLATLDSVYEERDKARSNLRLILARTERMPKVQLDAKKNGAALVVSLLREQKLLSESVIVALEASIAMAVADRASCAVCWRLLADCEAATPPCPGHEVRLAAAGKMATP